MKTRSFLKNNLPLLCICMLLLGFTALNGQELEQLISSKLEVLDELDHQFLNCNTYRLDDQTLYDNPNSLRLYENNRYRFKVQFTYFAEDELITHANYDDKSYSIKVRPSSQSNYLIGAISPSGDSLMIEATATGNAGVNEDLQIQLLDDSNKLLASVSYPFEIHSNDGDNTSTVFLPMKMEYKPIYITLEDANNPNNKIERQISPFIGDTININAKDALNLLVSVEEQVYLNNNAYVLVADHEKDYGYKAKFKWQGKSLRSKRGSKNGLLSHLTVVPGKTQPNTPRLTTSQIVAQNLKKSGLDMKGKRVQQQYTLVAPKTNVKKVYQRSYLKLHPEVLRTRMDQKQTQYLIQKNLPTLQLQMKQANKNLLQLYKPSQATFMHMQKATVPVTKSKPPAKTNSKIRTNKVQKVNPTNSKVKVQDHRKKPATSSTTVKVRPQTNTPVRRNETVVVTRPNRVAVAPSGPKSPYYTLAIELTRETDVMSYQTYFVTFRVIE